jgi:hypothetical protein
MRRRFAQPRMDTKWYKMSSGHLFPGHELTIYLDSSIRFHKTEGFLDACREAVGEGEYRLAFFMHPEGQRTIAEEAEFSMSFGKYEGEPCIEQVKHYESAGFPGGPLLAGGCIIRLAGEGTELFEKAWFDECVHWSVQDQISLPYVLWLHRLKYGILPGNIYSNDFFSRDWSGPNR